MSGLLPVTPAGVKLADQSFEKQAEVVLSNLEGVLLAAGSSIDQLVQVRIYITDIDNWPTFNKMYAAKLGNHRPARAVVPVPCLHYGFLLEVEAIGAL